VVAGVEKSVARCRTGRRIAGYYARMRFIDLTTCVARLLPVLALTSCATRPTKMPDPGPMDE
jgi:hypothetical protein